MLRMMIASAPEDEAIVVVEGASDVRALRPLVEAGVRIHALGGKSLIVGAHRDLEPSISERILFLVDCDNEDNDDLKGRHNLVITTYRDLECDLLFHLDGAKRAALECFGLDLNHESVFERLREELQLCTDLVCMFNATKDGARALQLPLRVRDQITGTKRRFGLADLPQLGQWAIGTHSLGIEEIATQLGQVLEWEGGCVAQVVTGAIECWDLACQRHSIEGCLTCKRMRLCNGHDLEAALVARFIHQGSDISLSEMERLVRVGADVGLLDSWPVVRRIRHFEGHTGLRILTAS